MSSLSIIPVKKALQNLKEALSVANPTDLERDGTIQRFEYSYELIWKFSQKILKENEINAETPRNIFRELGRIGWIVNVEDWFDFQKSRNETSHEYGEALANKSYQLAQKFYPMAEELVQILEIKSNQ